jgi:LuxR family quorum-sensing system transcriptional regulator CciR
MTETLAAEHSISLFPVSSLAEDEGVQDFARLIRASVDSRSLRSALVHVSRQLGFDYFALTYHIERRHLRVHLRPAEPFMLDDYPAAWKRLMMARRYFSDDPVLAAVEKSATAFAWSDIPTLIELTVRQREILQAAAAMGLGEGFTVPVHVLGDCSGSCSFITRTGQGLPRESLPAAQYLGAIAFETARHFAAATKIRAPRLTQRQFDCIVLVAQGKSDWDVGRLLGISDQTVHKHIEDAKRRYGVATRIQLVVRALFDNRLTFGDVLSGYPSHN